MDSLLVGRDRVCCICCFSSIHDVMFRWYQVPGSKFSILHSTCEGCSRDGWHLFESLCWSLIKTLYWHIPSLLFNVMIIEFLVEIVLTTLMLHWCVHSTMLLWEKKRKQSSLAGKQIKDLHLDIKKYRCCTAVEIWYAPWQIKLLF